MISTTSWLRVGTRSPAALEERHTERRLGDHLRVDVDVDLGLAVARLGQLHREIERRVEHPVVDRLGEPGHLRERQDLADAEHPADRMDPAHQRLDGDDLAGRVDDRLVERLDLAVGERVAELVELAAPLVDRVDRDAGGLGLGEPLGGHQLVARADQQRVEHLGLGVERAGGADPEVDLVVADDERLRHVTPDALAQHLDRALARRPDREHELVAAETGGDEVGPTDLVDPVGDRAQHRIAGRFAVQLVDRAEVHDVDDQDAQPATVLRSSSSALRMNPSRLSRPVRLSCSARKFTRLRASASAVAIWALIT